MKPMPVLLAFCALLFGALPAFAQTSATMCSAQTSQVCAKVQFLTEISTSTAGKFDIVIKVPPGQTISNFKALLWMPDMGHGSSPLKITQVNAQKFHVEEAYFVMPGNWLIQLNFNLGSSPVEIKFPLSVPN